jgi:predicted dehydrogenase
MRFGILSTADIALDSVLPAIHATDHEALAIASRDEDRAAEAADASGVPRSYGSYGALLEDDDVDAVYNPLPNALHAEWTERAADAGKHVLCEKPLAADADKARAVGDHCADAGVTLMEGFMYRYHPRTERAAEVADDLGEIRSVKADFQFPLTWAEDIRLSPELAGGSVMDVGVYPVNAARLFLGEPESVYAVQTDSRDSGVDTQTAAVLDYDGPTATVVSGFDTALVQRYRVEAIDGFLEVEDAFDTSGAGETTLRYELDGRTVEETFEPADAYRAEVEHFADCVETGETPRTDAAAAVETMRVVDAIQESAELGRAVDL